MHKIQRNREIGKISVLKDRDLIKVITGVRRCGKSTLLLQFQVVLRAENPLAAIVSINMDLPEFRFLGEKN
jgi:predicted AAA+ superfamily ATPase